MLAVHDEVAELPEGAIHIFIYIYIYIYILSFGTVI